MTFVESHGILDGLGDARPHCSDVTLMWVIFVASNFIFSCFGCILADRPKTVRTNDLRLM